MFTVSFEKVYAVLSLRVYKLFKINGIQIFNFCDGAGTGVALITEN